MVLATAVPANKGGTTKIRSEGGDRGRTIAP